MEEKRRASDRWYRLFVTLAVLIFAVLFIIRWYTHYEQAQDEWTIKTINAGFAVVSAEEGTDELSVRVPVAGLKKGDKVIVKGFYMDSGLPYISSKIATVTDTD
jgi:hypothetical protein